MPLRAGSSITGLRCVRHPDCKEALKVGVDIFYDDKQWEIIKDGNRWGFYIRPGAIEVLFRVRDRLSSYHLRIKSPVFEESPVLGDKLSRRGRIF